jgi:hypothetical protein
MVGSLGEQNFPLRYYTRPLSATAPVANCVSRDLIGSVTFFVLLHKENKDAGKF